MKDFPGTPGTFTGLFLRISQFMLAAASIASMAMAVGFANYTAFCFFLKNMIIFTSRWTCHGLPPHSLFRRVPWKCPYKPAFLHLNTYLIAAMGLQVVWCLGLACLDAYALARKTPLRSSILISLFVVGDWVTATLSLAAACASAGITVLYDKDLRYCNILECRKYKISVFLAFMSWLLIEISSLIMFWLLASG